MTDQLYELLMKLPKENLICVMNEALEEMKSYNGRSKFYCILTALGATEPDKVDEVPDHIPKEQQYKYISKKENTWKLPTLRKMIENTDLISF